MICCLPCFHVRFFCFQQLPLLIFSLLWFGRGAGASMCVTFGLKPDELVSSWELFYLNRLAGPHKAPSLQAYVKLMEVDA